MMTINSTIKILALSISILSLTAAVDPSVTVIGSADMVEVINQCAQSKKATLEFRNREHLYQETLQDWVNRPLLSEDEFILYSKASLDVKQTDEEKAAVTRYRDLGTERNRELNSLTNTKDTTAVQKARLQVLIDQQAKNSDLVQKYSRQYRVELDALKSDKLKEIITLAKKSLSAIAKKRGITAVFDGAIAIYSTNDLTQATIDDLNKKK